ncbi:MAG: hypothetical protein HZA53_19305 [Planctomycetes bacterium]|nr:hypothetical protein [Planctomycetota bacterium]
MNIIPNSEANTAPVVRPASTWRILLVFVFLAVVAGAIQFLATTRTGEVEAAVVLAPAFEVSTLPFGLEPRFAAELPFEQKLVQFTPRGAVFQDEKAEEPPAGDSKSGGDERKIQWKKLPLAPADAAPSQAALVFLGQLGKDALRAYLEDPSWKGFESLDDRGGRVAVESGTFPWAGFDARYTIVRKFAPPDRYVDSARVDLSAHGRWCALLVDWPRGATGSKAALIELANAFTPRPKPDEKP